MEKVIEEALYFIAQKGWAVSSQSYFSSLVTYLGEALGGDYVLVDELLPDRVTARTVVLYAKGEVVPNLEYSLAGTPCENVVGKGLCSYSRELRTLFPKDQLLTEMSAESYIGIPLWDSKGEASGLIAVIWSTPLSPSIRSMAEVVLQIVAVRSAHELDSLRQESRLKEYGLLLQSLVDGFYFAERSGRFLDVNVAYSRMTGYSVEELLSMSVSDLEAKESTVETQTRLENLEKIGYERFETRLRRKDETTFDAEISAQYLPDLGGRFAVLVRDISEFKCAERERATLELQLEHAKRLEAVGRLAGGVAHDFNNMLTVILGQSELMLSEPSLPECLYDDVRTISEAAERAALLTSQLLAFARKQPATPKILDLNGAIETLLDVLGRLLGENIELSWTPGRDLGKVRLDPTQLEQILLNLFMNARDAMAGKGTITISTHPTRLDGYDAVAEVVASSPVVQGGDYVCLTISDTGEGFCDEARKHLFEPFYSTKTIGRGTGLGLSTVYGIVKQNGGVISVQSEPQRGATFKIYLPRCLENVVNVAKSDVEPRRFSRRRTVLLVEDEPKVMRLVAAMLDALGFDVIPTGDPSEALLLAGEKSRKIDLLVTDVVMPVMNGKELYLRIHDICPETKCLFMSGYDAGVVAHHGVLDEGIHFIQKPFRTIDLGMRIENVFREYQSG